MAIYTQHGRYQKAKLFKEMLEEQNDTYMLLGLGNPKWDDPDSGQQMPNAPYDTSIMIEDQPNQFTDTLAQQKILTSSGIVTTVSDSIPQENTVINTCKNLVPPFPCIWHDANSNSTLIDGTTITQNTHENFYISNGILYDKVNGTSASITMPNDAVELQYYAELYLRGLAMAKGYKHPVGLLGAVKCDVSFVKDIGVEEDGNYVGGLSQFWYGDRYWEVVEPSEDDVTEYINEDNKIYPHHLLISATINPRQLCNALSIDRNITPREIAIYTKSKTQNTKSAYQVGNYIFNFGQYTDAELANMQKDIILQFMPPCTVNNVPYGKDQEVTNKFNFVLHDYVKGAIKSEHSVERFGYIVGF